MAKGLDVYKQRKEKLSSFGKNLTRRAKSCCELTGVSGSPLVIYELAPVPTEPDFKNCILISQNAADQIEKPKTINPDDWRKSRELIWSDQKNIQIMSFRILTFIAETQEWARLILEEAHLDQETIVQAQAHLIK